MTLPGFTATESLYTSARRYVGAPARGHRVDGSGIVPALMSTTTSTAGPSLAELLASIPKPSPCCQKCYDTGYPICYDEAAGCRCMLP
jgi:hypothetical protein